MYLTYKSPQDAILDGMEEAVEFGPFLIVNGKTSKIHGDGGWGTAPRSVIAQRKDGVVLLLIIEGRLSAFFVENADLRICLMTPFDVRSKRIAQREDKSVEVAKSEIITREKSEALRYMEIHNIDISNMDVYDLIINTDTFNPENVSEIIIQTLKVI